MAQHPDIYFNKLEEFLKDSSISPVGRYIDRKTAMEFFCTDCEGTFKTTPHSIYNGSARCTYCSGKNLNKKSIQIKLDKLDKNITVLSEYVDSITHMECMCNVCGHKWTSTFSNLKSNGCPSCNKRVRWSTDTFKTEVESKKNLVVLGEYKNAKTPILCQCNSCSLVWNSHPTTLLKSGAGCPCCAKSGFDPKKPGMLYYLRVSDGDSTYWKIGITNNSVEKRFCSLQDKSKITILYCYVFESGSIARQAEKNILTLFSQYRAKNVKILKLCGNTELFTKDVLQMNHLVPEDKPLC